MLHLELLGGLHITLNGVAVTGWVSSKAQALVCYLALTGRPQSRSALATFLWGEQSDADASANLRQALANVNRLLPAYLDVTRQTVAWSKVPPAVLDVAEFEARVGAQGARPDLAELEAAVALYRGDLLHGFMVRDAPAWDEWLVIQQERLRHRAVEALSTLAQAYSARGDYPTAIPATRRLLEIDPWREEAHRDLMLLLARSGQRSAALQQYNTCQRILQAELDVEPMAETVALFERIRAAGDVHRPLLPPQATPLIGRDTERAELARLFADPAVRLISLVGPGGSGKTRLALHLASERGMQFLQGAYFVPLAAVSSAAHLPSTLATVLGFQLRGSQDGEVQLLNYLRDKELLLVLDNFEHLIDAGVDLLDAILQRAPHVKLLVTSRERLRLQEEWVLLLEGLAVPPDAATPTGDAYGALQLFEEHARRLRVTLASEENACVVHICQLVEGLPLGIELAAATLRIHTCREIAQQIAHNLDFLQTALRNVPARQRSLRATWSYSWQLLVPEEQRVLRQLAVFHGGFERAAAEQVVHARPSVLHALIDKSLLRRSAVGRYELHELLRQFAQEQLQETEDEQVVHEGHCSFYSTFLYERQDQLKGPRQPDALREITTEIENVRAAWQWAVAQGSSAALDRAQDSLYQWYSIQGLAHEGVEVFQRAVDALSSSADEADTRPLGRLLSRQGALCMKLTRYDEATTALNRSLAIVQPLGALEEVAFVLNTFGIVARETGKYAEAQQYCREALDICEEVHDCWGAANALLALGGIAYRQGEYVEAQRHLRQGLVFQQQSGDPQGLANQLIGLGIVAVALGDYQAAKDYAAQSLPLYAAVGDKIGTAIAQAYQGEIARRLGQHAEAQQHLEAALMVYEDVGELMGIGDCLNALGDVAVAEGNYVEASRLFERYRVVSQQGDDPSGEATALVQLGAVYRLLGKAQEARQAVVDALRLATKIERVPIALESIVGLAALAAEGNDHERAVALLAFVQQHPASDQSTQDRVTPLLKRLLPLLPSTVAQTAQDRGKQQQFEAVVHELLR